MNNLFSNRVAKILLNFGGVNIFSLNIISWTVISERSVGFLMKKGGFTGSIRITQAQDNANVFVVVSKKVSDLKQIANRVEANSITQYINSLTESVWSAGTRQVERPQGEKAPVTELFTQEA